MREAILRLFQDHPGEALTADEVSARLDLGAGARHALRRELRSLCAAGLLGRAPSGHYVFAPPRQEGEGVIHFRASGGAEVVLDEGEALPVPARYLRGALPGDRVRVEVLPARHGTRRAAAVLGVVRPGPGQVVGVFRPAGRGGYVEPREPELFPFYLAIPAEARGAASAGDVVLAELAERPGGGGAVVGRVVKVLGVEDDAAVEVDVIACHHGLRVEFPEEVARAAARAPQRVTREEMRGREDWRGYPLVTIDGEDARDFDDAVHVERSRRGFLARIAIADVSHYVREGEPLDVEAAERGTSCYFPDRVLPMLPHELSNGICSLNPDVDRLALCVELSLSPAGEVRRSRFCEAVIRSHARLTYTEVFEAIERGGPLRGVGDPGPLVELCEALMRRRRERGSLDFDIPEARVVLRDGDVVDVVRRERNLAHRIVEELMIAANEAVARHFEMSEHPTVFRVHDAPDAEKLRVFGELAGALGFRLRPEDATDPRRLARFVEALRERPEAKALHTLLLRSMKQAFYDVENIGHFGLAAPEYLHFTSPIRRYPDLLVHRLLRSLLRGARRSPGEKEALAERLAELAARSSARERAAMEAEREVLAYWRARLMSRRIGETFEGVVAAVVPFGLFVEIERPFVDGLVHVQRLGDDFWEYDEEHQALVGRSSRRAYRLGDRLRVRVLDVNVARRHVDLALAAGEASAPDRRDEERGPRAQERRRSERRGGRRRRTR